MKSMKISFVLVFALVGFVQLLSLPYKEPVTTEGIDSNDFSEPVHCKNKFDCGDPRGICIPTKWVCDGEPDCGNGADEREFCNLVSTMGRTRCPQDQFPCSVNGTNQCIDKSYRCNGVKDCYLGLDEVGCSKTFSIIQLPPTVVNLTQGDTFNITCTIAGDPKLEVMWLLNGSMLYSGLDCDEITDNGVGTLICSNIQPSHAGFYSCIGNSFLGTIVATQGCQLNVEDNNV